MSCGPSSRGTTTSRSSPSSCSAGAAAGAGRGSAASIRPSSSLTALLDRRLLLRLRAHGRGARRRPSSAPCSSPSRRSTSSTGSSRTSIVLPAAAIVLVAQTVLEPSPEWALAALGAWLLPPRRRARLPGRDGHGRREARAADGRDARPDGAGRADGRDGRRARARRSCLLARHGMAARKMGIPFGPFLALGGVVALFVGDRLLDAYLDASLTRRGALALAARCR